MLRETLRIAFDDSVRGEDRAAAASAIPGLRPPILRRRTLRTAAALGVLGILYGSLAPFEIDPRRTLTWFPALGPLDPADTFSNILIYIPVGLCACLLFRRRGSSRLVEWLLSLGLALSLSYLSEVAQTVLARRVSSWHDVWANVLGAAIGILLAPMLQRALRNQHAWLYVELRRRPFTAAAAALTVAVSFAALVPFDLDPTPRHLSRSATRFFASVTVPPWQPAGEMSISGLDMLDKLTAAGAYSLVAFLAALAARERGCEPREALRCALRRSILLAAGIEAAQALTVSHVAHAWDLLAAWCCCLAGAGLAAAWLCLPEGRSLRPAPVLRLVLAVISLAAAVRISADAAVGSAAIPMESWMPMGDQFHRPWSSLIGSYSAAFLLYALIGAIIVLWQRSFRRRPVLPLIFTAVLSPPTIGATLAIASGHGFDTAHLLLAVLAAAGIWSVDLAMFGTRGASSARLRTPEFAGLPHGR